MGAEVADLQAIEQFKVTLCQFAESGRDALGSVEMEVRRMFDWLEHEQPAFWRKQIQIRQEQVVEAKQALARKRLASISGSKPSLVEEKSNLKHAEMRLAEAEEKLQATRKWSLTVRKATEEYEAKARQLAAYLEGDPPKFIQILEQIIGSLEDYLATQIPTEKMGIAPFVMPTDGEPNQKVT